MSLLTSPNTHKDHLKFFNKMEKLYHKRGFSQYISKEKSDLHPFTTKVPQEATEKMKTLMSNFTLGVKEIIEEFSMLDHYSILNIMRKHEIFADVANLISESLHIKIDGLQRELIKKDRKIEVLKRENKNYDLLNMSANLGEKKDFDEKSVKFNPSRSMASNLYFHAKALSEEAFVDFYNKSSLSNGITLTKIENIKKNLQLFTQEPRITLPGNMEEKINLILKLCKNCQQFETIETLLTSIKEQSLVECENHCCKNQRESPHFDFELQPKETKAKLILNSASNKPFNNIYKNDKSEEYFERYYRGASFNVQDVTSLTKTKLEEMERLENDHRRSLKNRRKIGGLSGHRYSVSFSRD